MSAQPAEMSRTPREAAAFHPASPWHYDGPRRERQYVSVDVDVLQEAHAQMHPDGTFFIENCWEPICRHLLGAA
jgi:hypothetical protein